jgi:hypothetical protein
MSENSERRRIIVSLDQPKPAAQIVQPKQRSVNSPAFLNQNENISAKKGSLFKKILAVFGILLFLGILAGGVGGYLWWTNLERSPAYSLALLVEAARRDDKAQIEQLFDTNAVVDDFVPQVVDKAKERYGRGFPPQVVSRATQLLTPILPAVKERAKQEIPRIIREKAQLAPEVSPWIFATGLKRVANVQETGDKTIVQAEVQNRKFELEMQRAGTRWKVVKIKDDVLADKIAEDVAQKILAIANKRQVAGQKQPSKELLEEIKRQIQSQQLTP